MYNDAPNGQTSIEVSFSKRADLYSLWKPNIFREWQVTHLKIESTYSVSLGLKSWPTAVHNSLHYEVWITGILLWAHLISFKSNIFEKTLLAVYANSKTAKSSKQLSMNLPLWQLFLVTLFCLTGNSSQRRRKNKTSWQLQGINCAYNNIFSKGRLEGRVCQCWSCTTYSDILWPSSAWT